MRIDQIGWLDATASFALLVAGLLLCYWELSRPGTFLPGALGAVLVLLAAARFSSMDVTPAGSILLGAAVVLFGVEVVWRGPLPPGLLSGLALSAAACRWGVADSERVRWYLALPLSLGLAWVTVVLTSAAWRGFWAKRNW
jgi:membrane-bound serine protease (ClpP class)